MSGKITVPCRAVFKQIVWKKCICTLFDWLGNEAMDSEKIEPKLNCEFDM